MATRRRSRSRSPTHDDNRRGGGGRRFGGGDSRMVFISNIAYETRWPELKTLLRDKCGEVSFMELLEERDGRPKGCAIVEFKTRDDAEKCVKGLHRYEFNGRALGVKEIREPVGFFRKIKEETGVDFLARTGGGAGGARSVRGDGDEREKRSGTYDLFGLSPQFLRQHSIDPPLCDRVFASNMSFNVGTAKIYEVFGLAGKIAWMDLHMDKEGRSKGACVIQFSHPIEAVQAVAMFNGQRLYDRPLMVKMDKFEKKDTRASEGALPKGLETIGMGLGAGGQPLADVAAVVANLPSGGSSTGSALATSQTPLNPFSGYGSSGMSSGMAAGSGLGGGGSALGSGTAGSLLGSGTFDRPSLGGSALGSSLGASLGNGSALAASHAADYGLGSGPGAGERPFGSTAYGSGMGGSSVASYGNASGMSLDYKKQDFYGRNAFDSVKQEQPFSVSAYSSSPSSRVIAIKNLPPDYTWQIVRDRVSQFGQIESVDQMAPGMFRVRFVLLQDAERTRSALIGTSVEGRPIQVEYV